MYVCFGRDPRGAVSGLACAGGAAVRVVRAMPCARIILAISKRRAGLDGDLARALSAMNSRCSAGGGAAVSTMTLSACVNVADVCRDVLLVAVEWAEGALHVPRKRKREFDNQTTVRHGSKSVKLFRNGRVHVTGCKSLADFQAAVADVCAALSDAGVRTSDGQPMRFDRVTVHMMNVTFDAGSRLRLRPLRDALTALGHAVRYDADVYPGLNAKLCTGDGRRVTALVFGSGKVILTGACGPADLDRAHRELVGAIDGCPCARAV